MADKKELSEMTKAELLVENVRLKAQTNDSAAAKRLQRIDSDPIDINLWVPIALLAIAGLAILGIILLKNSEFPTLVPAGAAVAVAEEAPVEDAAPIEDAVVPTEADNDAAVDLVPPSDDLSAVIIRCFDYRGAGGQTPNVCVFGEPYQAMWLGSSAFPVEALHEWCEKNNVETVDFNVKDLSRSLTFNPAFVDVSVNLASAIYGDEATNHLWYVNTDGVGSHIYDPEMDYQFFEIYDSSYVVLQ
jgi:hypothetical protein